MLVSQFVNEGLGNSSYLVASREAGVAAVIDPERTVEPYLEAAAALGLRITHVFETHLHADFVSGSRELAARTGAEICASAGAGLEFPHRPLREGDEVRVGELVFGVMETPGHTPEHVSFTLRQGGRTQPEAVFSGGALLVGGVARTDLLAEEMTVPLTRQLYHALHDKLLALPDAVEVYPTHGAGSFCSTPTGAERTTTIGRERRQNPPLRAASEAEFVEAVLEGLPSYPAYFRRLRAVNR
ncbi:MAG TPA: MBL fold metallo-hydrolase, partial [Dehalococcoidia bacterium]|nr:MBL fold metallo-hydrolase [Dehalococcoidia bacterium]